MPSRCSNTLPAATRHPQSPVSRAVQTGGTDRTVPGVGSRSVTGARPGAASRHPLTADERRVSTRAELTDCRAVAGPSATYRLPRGGGGDRPPTLPDSRHRADTAPTPDAQQCGLETQLSHAAGARGQVTPPAVTVAIPQCRPARGIAFTPCRLQTAAPPSGPITPHRRPGHAGAGIAHHAAAQRYAASGACISLPRNGGRHGTGAA